MSTISCHESSYPVMVDMYQQFLTLLDQYHKEHSRIFPVRFDLHYPQEISGNRSNTDISNCMFKINQYFKRKGSDPVYAWVREESENSDNPHYHCILLLNGQKKRNINEVYDVAKRLWCSTIQSDSSGLLDKCNKRGLNGIMINRSDEEHQKQVDNVVRQLSYMSKPLHKSEHNDGHRNYGMSRIH